MQSLTRHPRLDLALAAGLALLSGVALAAVWEGQLLAPTLAATVALVLGLGVTGQERLPEAAPPPRRPTPPRDWQLSPHPRAPGTRAERHRGRLRETLGDRFMGFELLGAGGTATVWSAYDSERGVRVAIKTSTDPVWLQVEGEILASLSHPGLPRVHEIGTGKVPYLVMDRIEGKGLDRILAYHVQLPLGEALRIACDLLEVLAYLHRDDLVHGDVKPANVVLTPPGSVKLLDFGIARRPGNCPEAVPGGGTPFFMAPEQLMGGPPTFSSEVYSYGLLLYWLLCGRPAFSLADHFRRDRPPVVPPSEVRREIPSWMDPLVLRFLAEDPAERYPDLAAAAQEILESPEPSPAPAPLPLSFPARHLPHPEERMDRAA